MMLAESDLIDQRLIAIGECLSDFRLGIMLWIQLDHPKNRVREKVRFVKPAHGKRFNLYFRNLVLLHHHLVRHDADEVIHDTDFIAVIEKRLLPVLVELVDLLGRDVS